MKALLVLALTLVLFTSCEKTDGKNSTGIIGYGTSFGMCANYCVRNMVVNKQEVVYSKSKNGTAPETKSCKKTISTDEWNTFKELLDSSNINALPNVIGCPDCADGGAEWVEIVSNGQKHRVTFEYNHAPNELRALVDQLRTLAASFNNCD